jgi:hypothetical protein
MDIFLAAFGTVVLYLAVRVLFENRKRDKEIITIGLTDEAQKETIRKRRIDSLYGRNNDD